MSLMELFGRYGKVDRVKKIKSYAFVHFEKWDQVNTRLSLADHW